MTKGIESDYLANRYASFLKFKRANESTGKEIAHVDIINGYKPDSSYKILEEEDFEAADAVKTRMIEIINFVDEREYDSLYYEHLYYLEPDKTVMKAYALLRDALDYQAKLELQHIFNH